MARSPTIAVVLSEPRERRSHQAEIKLRSCVVESVTKIEGIDGLLSLGFALNGISPSELRAGIEGEVKYDVQVTESGTNLIIVHTY